MYDETRKDLVRPQKGIQDSLVFVSTQINNSVNHEKDVRKLNEPLHKSKSKTPERMKMDMNEKINGLIKG